MSHHHIGSTTQFLSALSRTPWSICLILAARISVVSWDVSPPCSFTSRAASKLSGWTLLLRPIQGVKNGSWIYSIILAVFGGRKTGVGRQGVGTIKSSPFLGSWNFLIGLKRFRTDDLIWFQIISDTLPEGPMNAVAKQIQRKSPLSILISCRRRPKKINWTVSVN